MLLAWFIIVAFFAIVSPTVADGQPAMHYPLCIAVFSFLAYGGIKLSLKIRGRNMTENQVRRRLWLLRFLPLWVLPLSMFYTWIVDQLLMGAPASVWRFLYWHVIGL